MRRGEPPRYFQEEGDDAVHVALVFRGNLLEVAGVVEALRLGLEREHNGPAGRLLEELAVAEKDLREYDAALRQVEALDELDAGDETIDSPTPRCPCGDMEVHDCAGECGRPAS